MTESISAPILECRSMGSLLQVRDLAVRYHARDGTEFAAVDGMSFDVAAGEAVGLMGESGCGKSSVALALLALHDRECAAVAGSVRFEDAELLTLADRAMQKIRGAAISIIHQEPAIALSPVMRAGDQIAEVIHAHRESSWKKCGAEAREMLERVGLRPVDRIYSAFPHQLSGGQCQRVALAQALACGPRLLIADEPTAHLDARSQADFLALLEELRKQSGVAILLISHAPEVQARLADRLLVMKAGKIVEAGPFSTLYRNSSQEYTRKLLHAGQSEAETRVAAGDVASLEQISP